MCTGQPALLIQIKTLVKQKKEEEKKGNFVCTMVVKRFAAVGCQPPIQSLLFKYLHQCVCSYTTKTAKIIKE